MSKYQGSHTNRTRERVSVPGSRTRYADEIDDERQYGTNWQQRHPHQSDRRQIAPRMTGATTFRPEVSKDELDKHELNRLAKIKPQPHSRSARLVFNSSTNVSNKTKSRPPDYSDSASNDRESLANYRSEGPMGPSSARTSQPSRSSGASIEVRQKGNHSLSGICNKDTISKDNTIGHGAQMDDLLADFGRKAMRMKGQYEQVIPESNLDMLRPMNDEQFDPEELLKKRHVLRYRVSDTPHGTVKYLSDSKDEDEIVEAGKHRYALPRTPPRREYADKASTAMRYMQSSKKEHKERKMTPQYALVRQNGVPLDIPDEDSDRYESDIIEVEYYETD
uniref:Uncharacterized protein n=1 Tax=Gibberella zeae TaxID=5518 RepID=A0A4E9DU67_GIBZA